MACQSAAAARSTSPAGGVVSGLTINDPNDPRVTATANVLFGGTVDGPTIIDGGELILNAGAVFEPQAALTIVNNGWLLLEQNSFEGTIKDFGGSDTLDLAKIRFFIGQETTETFANGAASSRTGKPRRRPSPDRHLHDG